MIWIIPRGTDGGDDFFHVVEEFCHRHTPCVNVRDCGVRNGARQVKLSDRRTMSKIAKEWLEWSEEKNVIRRKRETLIVLANDFC